jgi:ABC-2 type transport system permease protein
MSRILLIARREFFAYVRSPLGAVVVAAALLIDGLYTYFFGMAEKHLSSEVLQEFFYAASGTTMAAAICLAMRLLAEERQTGTITLLNTAPIRDHEILLGKFLSAYAVIVVMTALTVYHPLLILVHGKVSWGHILIGYAGVLLLGAAALAIGVFASALARSQVVAVIVGAVLLAVMILMWMVSRAADPPLNTFLNALHHNNFMPFKLGVLELGPIAYYLAVTYFFLLAAAQVLHARRWR